jgi:flagellar motor protein MotB
MSYPIAVTVTDALGSVAVFEGLVVVDVLVLDEGGVLRIIVPAIIFGPDRGDFAGLAPDAMAANDRVLARIAEVLNRFEGYSVRVEGHANPVTPPGTAMRAEEEEGSPRILGLRPLSQARAQTVADRLAALGMDRARLHPVGMGGTRPIAPFEDSGRWWQNRRVEFILERP